MLSRKQSLLNVVKPRQSPVFSFFINLFGLCNIFLSWIWDGAQNFLYILCAAVLLLMIGTHWLRDKRVLWSLFIFTLVPVLTG